MEPCGAPCSMFVQLLNVLYIFIFSHFIFIFITESIESAKSAEYVESVASTESVSTSTESAF